MPSGGERWLLPLRIWTFNNNPWVNWKSGLKEEKFFGFETSGGGSKKEVSPPPYCRHFKTRIGKPRPKKNGIFAKIKNSMMGKYKNCAGGRIEGEGKCTPLPGNRGDWGVSLVKRAGDFDSCQSSCQSRNFKEDFITRTLLVKFVTTWYNLLRLEYKMAKIRRTVGFLETKLQQPP